MSVFHQGQLRSWHRTHLFQDKMLLEKVPTLSKDRCVLPSESGPTPDLGDQWLQGHCSRRLHRPTDSSLKALQLSLAVNLLFLDFSHVFLCSSDLGLEQAERKLLVFTFFCFNRLLPLPMSGRLLHGLSASHLLREAFLTHPLPLQHKPALSCLLFYGAGGWGGGLPQLPLSPALSSPVSLLCSETRRCIMANQSARKWLGTIRFVKAFREIIYFL